MTRIQRPLLAAHPHLSHRLHLLLLWRIAVGIWKDMYSLVPQPPRTEYQTIQKKVPKTVMQLVPETVMKTMQRPVRFVLSSKGR